jgi:hypothetical protein
MVRISDLLWLVRNSKKSAVDFLLEFVNQHQWGTRAPGSWKPPRAYVLAVGLTA